MSTFLLAIHRDHDVIPFSEFDCLVIACIGMAECHLLKARLYDLAGAKNLASHEYKTFLAKVTEHPEKKKFEKYIKDNPE
ncbi:MAG: hypothetical protein KA746_07010 [Pyrinomonadaceae bacterium]|nr:hypothetical protein [Pyrinomonadaceae bacterium]